MKHRLKNEALKLRRGSEVESTELERAIRSAWREAATDGRVHEIRRTIWSGLVRRLRRLHVASR